MSLLSSYAQEALLEALFKALADRDQTMDVPLSVGLRGAIKVALSDMGIDDVSVHSLGEFLMKFAPIGTKRTAQDLMNALV